MMCVMEKDLDRMLRSKIHFGDYSHDSNLLFGDRMEAYSRNESYGHFRVAFFKRIYRAKIKVRMWVTLWFNDGYEVHATRTFRTVTGNDSDARARLTKTNKQIDKFAAMAFGIKKIVWNYLEEEG